MTNQGFSTPPRRIRRAKMDNLALVPGNLLVYKATRQNMANRLPRRAILIVVPEGRSGQKDMMLRVAKDLAKAGYQVSIMLMSELRRRRRAPMKAVQA
jgi:hypothetical protein